MQNSPREWNMTTNPHSNTLLPPELLDRPITGRELVGRTLREELGHEARLLVFLRHFG